MPTIKQVAELAGVSVGTVSHVITGSVAVSEPLRLKVQAAIRQLDYHPNHVARSLKTSRTRALGIIVPDMTISFFPQVIRGAEAAARKQDYWVIAANSDENPERQRDLLSLLRSQRVEGILLVIASGATPVMQISRILDSGIAMVCLDRIPDRIPVDSVCVENVSAAALGVRHLAERGYRRIAAITGSLALRNERRRVLGYKQALEAAGLGVEAGLIWEGDLQADHVAALVRDGLRRWEPDALFATNGPTGLGALRALRDCGLETPGDLGFVTFDELAVDELFSPAITTIVQPAFDIGYRAAEVLLDRIEESGERAPARAIQLPATLKVRDSSRPKPAFRGQAT